MRSTKVPGLVVAVLLMQVLASLTWSERAFAQCPNPDAFSLTSPANGATGVSPTVTLSWGASSGAGSYIVHVGTTNPPSPQNDQTVTGTSATPSSWVGPLAVGWTYYWSVEAVASCDGSKKTLNTSGQRSFTVVPVGYRAWLAVGSHAGGANNSQWRSDLGITNPNSSIASYEVRFYGSDGILTSTAFVTANGQSILQDVVGQLGGSGSGAIEVRADQPVRVTGRTYNLVASSAGCFPTGTLGQDYVGFKAEDGLATGQTAILGQLTENTAYRTNIGLTNAGSGNATTSVTLYDGAGTLLTSYTVSLTPGEWKQENQPFKKRAGLTNMQRGWAKITVTAGSGVYAYASVIDNITNDPTTIPMQR